VFSLSGDRTQAIQAQQRNQARAVRTVAAQIAGPAAAAVDAAASVVGRGLGHDAGIVLVSGSASIGHGREP
jgi:hypothetical protein